MAKKREDRVLGALCRQTAVMLKAGIAPEEALRLLREDAREPEESEAVGALCDAMESGAGFGAAARESGLFSDSAVDLIQAGETAGRLEQCLLSLAEDLERRAMLRERIRTALTYPVVLLLLMCAVLAVLVFAVLPVFTGVYENLAGSLAGTSYAYVTAAGVIGRVCLAATALVCAAALLGVAAAGKPEGDRALRGALSRLRSVREALYQLEASRFAGMLAALTASGLDPASALHQAAGAAGHELLDPALRACCAQVDGGESLARSFRAQKLFPAAYSGMLLAADSGGELNRGLSELAERSARDGLARLCRLIDGVEPALTAFLTVAVGLSLLSVMLPLIGIMGSIG